MPPIAFNAGIYRLNKQDEKLQKIKERVSKVVKGLEEEKPPHYQKFIKFA